MELVEVKASECRRCDGDGWLLVNGVPVLCPVCKNAGGPNLAYILERSSDGFVLDPRRCPRQIHQRSHFHTAPDGKPACSCDPVEVADEAKAHTKALAEQRAERQGRRRSRSPRPPVSAQRKAAS